MPRLVRLLERRGFGDCEDSADGGDRAAAINPVLYHGVLGARAAWRAAVVRCRTAQGELRTEDPHEQAAPDATNYDTTAVAPRCARGRHWADLMRRAVGFEVLACPRCGGRLCLIALIDQGPSSSRSSVTSANPPRSRLDARPRAAKPEVCPCSASPTPPGLFPLSSSPPGLTICAVTVGLRA